MTQYNMTDRDITTIETAAHLLHDLAVALTHGTINNRSTPFEGAKTFCALAKLCRIDLFDLHSSIVRESTGEGRVA